MKENESNLVWKIAGGVVLGGLILGGLQSCRERMAIAQANEEMARILSESKEQSEQVREQFAARAEAEHQAQSERAETEFASRQLASDERCIGKDLFRRVDNGWVQIMDGSAALKCGR